MTNQEQNQPQPENPEQRSPDPEQQTQHQGSPRLRHAASAISFMSEQEQDDWCLLDGAIRNGNSLNTSAITEARERQMLVPGQYGFQDRAERNRILRDARPSTERLVREVAQVLRNSGSETELMHVAQRYFQSFYAKYCALSKARESLPVDERPHIGAIVTEAERFDPFKFEFEEARLHTIRRDWVSTTRAQGYEVRPIINPGWRRRAREQMCLKLLKTCYGDFLRDDQYGVEGRGREAAVSRAFKILRLPTIQYVAECDISNFYPSIGVGSGRVSCNALQDEFPMLPISVIESCVLASGVLFTQASLSGSLEARRRISDRQGVAQGSALSSWIAEYVMFHLMDTMSNSMAYMPTLVAYVDNVNNHLKLTHVCK